jgi:hypothetical protein
MDDAMGSGGHRSAPNSPSRYSPLQARQPMNSQAYGVCARARTHAHTSTVTTNDSVNDLESEPNTPLKERLVRRTTGGSQQGPYDASAVLAEHDVRAARRLAERLYALEGFRPIDVCTQLMKG